MIEITFARANWLIQLTIKRIKHPPLS